MDRSVGVYVLPCMGYKPILHGIAVHTPLHGVRIAVYHGYHQPRDLPDPVFWYLLQKSDLGFGVLGFGGSRQDLLNPIEGSVQCAHHVFIPCIAVSSRRTYKGICIWDIGVYTRYGTVCTGTCRARMVAV